MPIKRKEVHAAKKIDPEKHVEVRWSIPKDILDGFKAAHLVHGGGESLQAFVARALHAFTPEGFRK